jgi:flavin reductase (DIM6/NTAB) family NADH-FMN oxidoreductase RutF
MSGAPSTDFRRLMARWATGVSIVTASAEGDDHGLTVNAFLSVSLNPPTVLVSVTLDADTTPVLDRTRKFAVNFLAFDQKELSQRFAEVIPHRAKFEGVALTRGVTGAALLSSTLGSLEAEVNQHLDVADHRLFLARVVAVHPGREVAPLLFYRSRYAASDGARQLTLEPP